MRRLLTLAGSKLFFGRAGVGNCTVSYLSGWEKTPLVRGCAATMRGNIKVLP